MATPFRDLVLDDWQIVDDPELIVLRHRDTFTGSPPDTPSAVFAFRDELTAREIDASNGVYTSKDQVWFLPCSQLTTAAEFPVPGDYFTDPDPAYTGSPAAPRLVVIDVGRNPERQYWRVVARDLALHYQLSELVSHLRPANTADAAGGREALPFTTAAANVRARIQERDRRAETVHGRKAVRIGYAIWVETTLRVQAQDVIRDASGNDYTVLNAIDPDRIDALQEIQCERIV